jgi:hypothetical protein
MGFVEKHQKALNQNAQNQFWGGVASNVGGNIKQHFDDQEKSQATEQVLGTLNPQLANRGLGEALTKNPQLAEIIVGPYIRQQNAMTAMDKESSLRMALEDKDFANAQALEEMRYGNQRSAANQDAMLRSKMDRESVDYRTRSGIQEERARALTKRGIEAQDYGGEEAMVRTKRRGIELDLKTADTKQRIADLELDRAKGTPILEGEYYRNDISPREMNAMRKSGRTLEDLDRVGLGRADQTRAQSYAKQVDETARANRVREKQRRAEFEWKTKSKEIDQALSQKSIDQRALNVLLATPGGTVAVMKDLELRDRVQNIIPNLFDSLDPDLRSSESAGGSAQGGGAPAAPGSFDEESLGQNYSMAVTAAKSKFPTGSPYRGAFNTLVQQYERAQTIEERAATLQKIQNLIKINDNRGGK